jgi:hypothetical protein
MPNFLLFLLLLSGVLHAEPLRLQAFNQAKLFNQEQLSMVHYRLALSPYSKRENRVQPEKFLLLAGQLYRETHELPAGFDEQDVFDSYREQIPTSATLLFSCERRNCGESNDWANVHFRIKQLYGLNQYQFYSVYQIADNQYLTLYVVRRGNRRVYVQIETLVAVLPSLNQPSQK